MAEFVRVASVQDIEDPGRMLVEVNDTLLVIIHAGGQFYCLEDVCTHDGGPLAEGELDGVELACPRHGAKFDIRNGHALTMPATKPTRCFETRVEGDDVLVQVPDES